MVFRTHFPKIEFLACLSSVIALEIQGDLPVTFFLLVLLLSSNNYVLCNVYFFKLANLFIIRLNAINQL